jgi:5-carboxymethyl-2-hydroxymuconate isomerase
MPHFVIDCSEHVINELTSPEELMQEVYNIAESSQLFADKDVKVRINPFRYHNNGNTKEDFIFVFAHLIEGRSTAQKNELSRKIVGRLKVLFPNVPQISMNIRDIEKATYCNKAMVS